MGLSLITFPKHRKVRDGEIIKVFGMKTQLMVLRNGERSGERINRYSTIIALRKHAENRKILNILITMLR